jgi:hypothetical protein
VQRLRELLAHGGIAILAIVFALAFAAFELVQSIAYQVVLAIQQGFDDESGDPVFDFTIADTRVDVTEVVLFAITVTLLTGALFGVWWLTRRTTRTCTECRSAVPAGASICRFCTTELAPSTDA